MCPKSTQLSGTEKIQTLFFTHFEDRKPRKEILQFLEFSASALWKQRHKPFETSYLQPPFGPCGQRKCLPGNSTNYGKIGDLHPLPAFCHPTTPSSYQGNYICLKKATFSNKLGFHSKKTKKLLQKTHREIHTLLGNSTKKWNSLINQWDKLILYVRCPFSHCYWEEDQQYKITVLRWRQL